MSEPTKEQDIEVAGFDAGVEFAARWLEGNSFAGYASEIRTLAEAKRARLAALAPSAQTQQGLSGWAWLGTDGRVLTEAQLRACVTACNALLNYEANPSAEGARAMASARKSLWDATQPAPAIITEKQPSPATAPAQLSEAKAYEIAGQCLRPIEGQPEAQQRAADAIAGALMRAALAGQPAPTEDREALRAAALEGALRDCIVARHTDKALGHPDAFSECTDWICKVARFALAGSPAQQAHSIIDLAIETPEQGQLGKKEGEG